MNSKPNLPARLILQKLEPVSDLHADPLSLPTQSPDRLLSEQKIAREPLYDKPSECEAGLMVQHNPSFDASDRNDFPSDPFANPYYVAQLNNQGNLLRMDHDLTPNSQCFGDSLYNSDEEAAGGGSAFPKGTTNASDSSEARLFDPRLAALNISFWTMVTISDYDAANIISQFLYQDLPIFAVLKPHLLVASLVEKRLDFCSSFLVNSLLALGSVSFGLIPSQGELLSAWLATVCRSGSGVEHTEPDVRKRGHRVIANWELLGFVDNRGRLGFFSLGSFELRARASRETLSGSGIGNGGQVEAL